ncbi:MAG: hypothetical protein WKF91_16975 [Segetibacter sp.]
MTKHYLIVTGLLSLPIALFSFFWFKKDIQSNKPASEPTYHLAFASFGPLNTDIFIADADGSNARPFLPHSALDYNASFASDGIVFTSERNGPADIYRAHPDGTALEQLTNDSAFDDQAVFSPDGKKIAFVSSRNGQADIYILETASKKITNITNNSSGDFRPAWSPDGKWIAFSSDRESNKPKVNGGFVTAQSTEIFIIQTNGTGLRRITHNQAYAGSPCWSRDGNKLIIYEGEIAEVNKITGVRGLSGTTQIASINLKTNEQKVLTSTPGEKLSPHWASSADRIAYSSRGPNGGIEFLQGPAGTRGEFQSPSWSADGTKMLFHREQNFERPPFAILFSRNKQFQLIRSGIFPSFFGSQLICNDKTAGILLNKIMLMNAKDGTHRSILFGDSVKSALAPVFSPQGDKIAFGFGRFFQTVQGKTIADIVVINSDGSGLKILTDGKGNYGFPSSSPDGKKIVYRASTDSVKGLFIVDVETGKITTLTIDSHDNFPGWSPNGDLIAFTSKREDNYDIYTIKPDGSGLKRLTNNKANDAHSAWSPDGKWIAFSSGIGRFKDESVLHPLNPQPYGEICVMRADGSDKRVLTDNQYEEATPGWMPLKK